MISADLAHSSNAGAISPREAFAQQLNVLYAAAGSPSLRALAMKAQYRTQTGRAPRSSVSVTAQRISDWKSGRNVPARFDALHPVLLTLIDGARRRGDATGVVLNMREWKQLWDRVQAARINASHGRRRQRASAAACRPQESLVAMSAGRETALRSLTEMVGDALGGGRDGRVITLTGASGVGKTSLLAAGLTPALKNDDAQLISVRSTDISRDSVSMLTSILSELRCPGSGQRGQKTPAGISELVIVDQFEAILTASFPSAAREEIVALLAELAEVSVVLICLCSSFIPNCHSYPLLADALENRRLQLEPMTTAELRAVVQAGIGKGGSGDAPGVEEALIATICGIRGDADRFGREPGELPILTRTLSSMASNLHGARSDMDSYRRLGGVEGVVHAMAEAAWSAMSGRERTEGKRILLRLVDVHTDVGYIRRRMPLQDGLDLLDDAERALATLVGARLITIDHHRIQLSHDLVLTWPTLRTWLDELFATRWTDQEGDGTDRNRAWEYVTLNPRLLR
ncbi:nSTAND1 domain-containing NTPase [Nocardia sp. X0981]